MPFLGNLVRFAAGDLSCHLAVHCVLRGEGDVPLGLNLEQRVAGRACSMEDQVVEAVAEIRTLEPDADNPRPRHAMRRYPGQHRQQVEGAKLAFDIGACPAA